MPNYEPVLRRQQGELFDPLELEHGLELECKCVQVDADEWDARHCPEHGPHSSAAREEREQEAADEAAYWSHPGWAEVFAEPEVKQYDRLRLTPAGEVKSVGEEAA